MNKSIIINKPFVFLSTGSSLVERGHGAKGIWTLCQKEKGKERKERQKKQKEVNTSHLSIAVKKMFLNKFVSLVFFLLISGLLPITEILCVCLKKDIYVA